ncbi:MAG: hypothetical protein M1827_006472 [Pycnora praestabilis]|nr:MAG: hypothetical protein M1827_006472 [Pycnora praestabilis]
MSGSNNPFVTTDSPYAPSTLPANSAPHHLASPTSAASAPAVVDETPNTNTTTTTTTTTDDVRTGKGNGDGIGAAGGLQRVTMYIKRLPSMSEEEFYHHWEHVHAPLVAPWFLKHGIVGYTQYHTTTPHHALTTQFFLHPSSPYRVSANPLGSYTGSAEILLPSLSNLANAFADPFYEDVVRKDEDKFIERPAEGGVVCVAMGVERRVLGGGRVVGGEEDGGESGGLYEKGRERFRAFEEVRGGG